MASTSNSETLSEPTFSSLPTSSSSESTVQEKHTIERCKLEEFALLMEERAFVDYFNVFLSLPVFGQHVNYNFFEKEFQFEPPIRRRRHYFLDYGQVLKWLYKERFLLFQTSPLFLEYSLCHKLLEGTGDTNDTEKILIRNCLGSAVGMLLFRENMRGTCGENVYRCWKDIEAWNHLKDPIKKLYWKRAIKNKYIADSSTADVSSKVKLVVFTGVLNFELVPEGDIQEQVLSGILSKDTVKKLETEEALEQLQVVLLIALKTYWVPRFILHVRKTVKPESLEILTRSRGRDEESLRKEREMRCRFMFPLTSQEDAEVSESFTSVLSVEDEDLSSLSSIEEELEEEIRVEPKDLLAIWGGPTQNIEMKTPGFSCSPPRLSDDESYESVEKSDFEKDKDFSPSRVAKSPCPIVLTSYLGGKRRTQLGMFPSTSNRIIWSLASDNLASHPFERFLAHMDQILDLHYLGFWTDVRNYLDTDDTMMDCLGQPLRRSMAHRLASKYLMSTGDAAEIFSENLKMSLLNALSQNNNVSLLCVAQDIVLDALWEPLKFYIESERRRFLKQVRGLRYNLSLKKRRLLDQQEKSIRSRSDGVDPLFFYQINAKEDASQLYTSPSRNPSLPFDPADKPRETSVHVCITEEQLLKAMELNVLCSEYGTSMMIPQNLPKTDFLVDILCSDFGSLTVTRVAAFRQEWLRKMVRPQKINIETVRVSQNVILERPDFASFAREREARAIAEAKPAARMAVRRSGISIERPQKPKSFTEVLSVSQHYDFFKRFMILNKASLPIMFWRAVEDLKGIHNLKTKQIRVSQIIRKFFGKFSKYGALLDCHEEIIRQIPRMDKVTSGILICAQAAIFRSMERKWYPQYLETYPPDITETPTEQSSTLLPVIIRETALEMTDNVYATTKKRSRKRDKYKTVSLWEMASKSLLEFYRSLKNASEVQLFEAFLKCEMEKEQQPVDIKQGIDRHMLHSSMASNLQTRVVIKNRLVILNRLPSDMRFWIEVQKYQDLTDSACTDYTFLCDKAKSIICMFIASEIAPRLQINIPNDMATTIIQTLASTGAVRSLFHDAVVLLFPVMYHYWKKFRDEWLNKEIPKDIIEDIQRTYRERISTMPHRNILMPTYIDADSLNMKRITQITLDDQIRIHFSIMEGITVIYPQARQARASEGHALVRRNTRVSTINIDNVTRKESKSVMADIRKESKLSVKHDKKKSPTSAERRENRRRSTRRSSTIDESVLRNLAMEKSKKLSKLVEDVHLEESPEAGRHRGTRKLGFDSVVGMALSDMF